MPGILNLSPTCSPFPYAAVAIATFTKEAEIVFDEAAPEVTLDIREGRIAGEEDIVINLAKSGGIAVVGSTSHDFVAIAQALSKSTAVSEIIASLDSIDDHLAYRTFLVGHDITGSDFILWGSIKGSAKAAGLLKNNKHLHLSRWYFFIEALESTQLALAQLLEAKANRARSSKTAASFSLGLQGAKDGAVVTRFPPEPSGYLHIGHAKAAMLNQYFAKMYHGKMIVRFDDTNPTKERSEFEETILEDLALLEIHGDQVTHTSDHFDYLYGLAVKLIESGKAYADDTEQAQMRAERMDGIASQRRSASVEENIRHFAEMKTGTGEGLRWCVRAKMSVDNPNKAMRDPVIYRCNPIPHHRTGDKWKIYPTYDFACPIVDSLEGVTHALRTNEYRDRNPQYQWMIEALDLRPVNIWDYSRLNFIYTLLSKRKLHWFVDQGLVKGWDDPRFPTVRGIRRRGLTVEALRQFMLAQGPSQAIVSHEWDSIWAINKKIIDPVAPRFWALTKEGLVHATLEGGPLNPESKTLPRHKKNPEVGEKTTIYTSSLLLEAEDVLAFTEGEEVTLMDWGNAIVGSRTPGADGHASSLSLTLHLDGDFRKTKWKVTWLAAPPAATLVEVTLLDYDYLITKKKLEDDDELANFVTPVSEFRVEALADPNVRGLARGDIIQFERKGYYIYDGERDGRMEFIRIPDGKAASLASKAGVPAKLENEDAAPKEKGKVKVKPGKESKSKVPPTPVPEPEPPVTADTKMYKTTPVYGDGPLHAPADTKMFKVKSVYDV